jgi:hypothetical protein
MKKIIAGTLLATSLIFGGTSFASAAQATPTVDLTMKVSKSTAMYQFTGKPNETFNIVVYVNDKLNATSTFTLDKNGRFVLRALKKNMVKGNYDVYVVNKNKTVQLDNESFSIQ